MAMKRNWIWIALTIMALAGLSTFVDNYEARKSQEKHLAFSQYLYSPKECLYQVEFPEKPKIDEVSSTNGVSVLKSEIAELSMPDDESYVRSEFIVLGRDTLKNFTIDILHTILKQYSINNGLSNPEFRDSENELGRQFELRGYKTLKDGNLQERHLIMAARLFFKENNLLILYAASEAEDFPTPGIMKFFNSVKLKENNRPALESLRGKN